MKRVRRRLLVGQVLGALALAIVVLSVLWVMLPGLPHQLREALLFGLLLVIGAGLIVFFWIDHRRRRDISRRS